MTDDVYDQLRAIHLAAAALQTDGQLRKFLGVPLADSLLELMRDQRMEGQIVRLADLAKLIIAASSQPPDCPNHHLVQHRDHKPPWCRSCGRTRWGLDKNTLGAAS